MKIIITNMCEDGNRGDLAILAGTIKAVRAAAPDAVITVAPMEVSRSERLQAVQSDSAALSDRELIPSPMPARRSDRRSWASWGFRLVRALVSVRPRFRALRSPVDRRFGDELASADLVIAKGGSWLFSYREPQQVIFTLRMLYPLRVAQASGTPTAVLGTSLGPWQSYNRAAYVETLGRCGSVIVRERLSEDYAVRHGLSNVVRGVDMAYALYEGDKAPLSRSGFAITPRELPYESTAARTRYEQSIVAAARALIDEQREPCFLATQVHHDLPLCLKLRDQIARPGMVEVADVNEMPLSDLIEWYGSRELLLGTRVHSVILAAMAQTSSVILECDPPKMVGISEQLGLSGWRVQAGGEEVAGLPDLARRAFAERLKVRQRLDVATAELCRQANAQVSQLIDGLART